MPLSYRSQQLPICVSCFLHKDENPKFQRKKPIRQFSPHFTDTFKYMYQTWNPIQNNCSKLSIISTILKIWAHGCSERNVSLNILRHAVIIIANAYIGLIYCQPLFYSPNKYVYIYNVNLHNNPTNSYHYYIIPIVQMNKLAQRI